MKVKQNEIGKLQSSIQNRKMEKSRKYERQSKEKESLCPFLRCANC
jgi:hypothetical protein